MDIKKQLLDRCVEILTSISQEKFDSKCGNPPSVFYIDYGIGSNSESMLTKIEETYLLDNGQLQLAETGQKNITTQISGMYYKEGYAWISYDMTAMKAYLSFMVGPRYGRGFAYPLVGAEGNYALGEQNEVWVS